MFSLFSEIYSKFASKLPSESDEDGVVTSFIRLQQTYNITAKQMANGDILGNNAPSLTGFEYFFYLLQDTIFNSLFRNGTVYTPNWGSSDKLRPILMVTAYEHSKQTLVCLN